MIGRRGPQQYELALCVVETPDTLARRLLRKISERIDLEFVRALAAPHFASGGRPSIDPVLMVKMMLIGYLFGIPSDRQLVEECADRLSFREFLGLNLSESLPAHASFTHWRQRLGPEWFRSVLHAIVEQCVAQGLEVSTARTVDATTVKAQAGEHGPRVAVPATESDVRGYLERLFAGEEPALPPPDEQRVVNLHDPDAGLQKKGGRPAEFAYQSSFAVDPESGLVTDATATTFETPATALDHVCHDPYRVTELAADAFYDTTQGLADLQSRGVTTYVPQCPKGKAERLSKAAFTYDAERDVYVCPEGELLRHRGYWRKRRLHSYLAPAGACAACPRKAHCTPAKRRRVTRLEGEAAREQAVRSGPRYQELSGRRRVHEYLHQVAKRDHGLRRARALGLAAMRIQAALTAVVLNLKRLVRWRPSKPAAATQLAALGGCRFRWPGRALRLTGRRLRRWPRSLALLWAWLRSAGAHAATALRPRPLATAPSSGC